MADRNKQPLVSVILPAHNAEHTIRSAIDSIISQSFQFWELIIINDGSTDRTLEVLKEWKDQKIKVFSIEHSGIARALNYGIKLSSGVYIARMDADDVSTTQRLEKQVTFLRKNEDIGLVSCRVEHTGDPKRQLGYNQYVEWTNGLLSAEDILTSRFQDAPFAHPSVMFRKSIFFKFGGYSEANIPEDFELWLRWLYKGVLMAKIPEVLLKWQDREDRLSRTSRNYSSEQFFKVKAKYFMYWLRSRDDFENILIFGAGRIVNKRLRPFIKLGLQPSGFIDVREKPRSSDHIYYRDLVKFDMEKTLVLSFVSDRRGKNEITHSLHHLGYQRGKNYFMMT